ncbi:hypothetical protein Mgra_00010235 [Meloidogyne graminicola]|uniref:Uncharacterized protein n=1 Tax=Meloidogyne graminicola TaxID=189291 RepID=A0A8S9Z7D1_9BILA|nr:hypothetical protein Mgra_00010235 [Meloidogyne graminicola]
MAFFNKYFSSLLIISLTIIVNGMDKGTTSSSSSSCNVIIGKFEHIGNTKNIQMKANNNTKPYYLNISGGEPTNIKLQFNNEECLAINNNKTVECKIKRNTKEGIIYFNITPTKTVKVPFNAPMFSDNKCNIKIGIYDEGKRELFITINDVQYKIIQSNNSTVVPCRANTV